VNNLPKHLFRFRPWSVLKRDHSGNVVERKYLDELKEGIFYCSSPRGFDDPHDNQLGAFATGSHLDMDRWLHLDMDGVPELMRKYKLSSITQLFNEETIKNPEDKKVLTAMAGRHARRKTRVICLSGDWKNELMWAFYADNHRGMCFCFSTEHEFFRAAKPVLYTHSPTDVEYVVDSKSEVDPMAYCKSLAWQFQKEWRIVFQGDEPKKLQFPKESLSAVILGYRFPKIQIDELKKLLLDGGYRVELLLAERISKSYELGFRKLESIGETKQQF